ncbi:MAG: inositol monophosphatase [Rhodothermales bacterium]|nr:inositol monophosphatase [Rhodothermales bacterium]
MVSYEKERDAAVHAAREAGKLILSMAGKIRSGDFRTKGVNDLVTDVDIQAQNIITEYLSQVFPDYAVLAEEDVVDDRGIEAAAGFRWIVDPIDGTTNFMHGVPPFAVSIGLQKNDEMVVGVVLDVSRNELFSAVRGGGLQIDGSVGHVSKTKSLGDSLLTTGFPYRRFKDVDAYLAVLRSIILEARGVRRPGSASVDLAYVAAGRFDGFYETGLAPWDVAAGVLLVEEAGGKVTTMSTSGDPIFGRQIVATNGQIHGELLTHLGPLNGVTS